MKSTNGTCCEFDAGCDRRFGGRSAARLRWGSEETSVLLPPFAAEVAALFGVIGDLPE
jgi:hypothetical protein